MIGDGDDDDDDDGDGDDGDGLKTRSGHRTDKARTNTFHKNFRMEIV